MNVWAYRITYCDNNVPKEERYQSVLSVKHFFVLFQKLDKRYKLLFAKDVLGIKRKAYFLNTVKTIASLKVRYNVSNNASVSSNTW